MQRERHWKDSKLSQIAIFDLDDTLLDLKSVIVDSLNRRTGKNLTVDDFRNDAEYHYGVTRNDFLRIAEEDQMLQKAVPHDGIHELIQTLRQQGTKTVVVTARAWHPKALSVTQQWFDKHRIDVDEIMIVGMNDSKAEAISHMRNVRLAVDDRPDVVLDYQLRSQLNNAFLYSQHWNSHATDMKRVDSLEQLTTLIRSHTI